MDPPSKMSSQTLWLCPGLHGLSHYKSWISFTLCSLLSSSCGLSTYSCWQHTHMITERKEKRLRFHSVLAKPGHVPHAQGFSFLGKSEQSSEHTQKTALSKSLEKFSYFLSVQLQTTSVRRRKNNLSECLRRPKCSISTNDCR